MSNNGLPGMVLRTADTISDSGGSDRVTTGTRIGQVTAVDTTNISATVRYGEATDPNPILIPGHHWLAGHEPSVGDFVHVLVQDGDYFIIGRIATAMGATATPTYGAKVTGPTGTTAVASLTSAFASGSDVAVTWGTELHDDGGIWSAGSSTRMTVPTGGDGWWAVGGRIHFSGNLGTVGDYRFAVTIKMSGTNRGRYQLHETVKNYANGWVLQSSDVIYAVGGDYFELFGFQDSGTAMSILTTVGEGSNSFYAFRLGG
jgi:hypothetical protein